MQCPYCDKENDESSLFCRFCGGRIVKEQQEQSDDRMQAIAKSSPKSDDDRDGGGVERIKKHATKILKSSTIIGIIGVAGFLAIVLVCLVAYGKIYFFDGYKITKVLCVLDIILMLSGAIGIMAGLALSWKQPADAKRKIISVVLVALALTLSVVLIANGVSNGKKSSSSSEGGSGYSYQMDHSTYCLLYMKVSDVRVTHSGNYAYISGTIKNTGTYQIKYVKVRAVCKNSAGTVIDTDWTYAVDSDWLNPGESKSFQMMVRDTTNSIKTATVTVVANS